MGGIHSRKDQISQMLKRMLLLVAGLLFVGCAEDGESVTESNSALSGVIDNVRDKSLALGYFTNNSGVVYDFRVASYNGQSIVTIRTNNSVIRQITVREASDLNSERGYCYSSTGTAVVYLTHEHLVGSLFPGLMNNVTSGVGYDSSYDPTNRSNCTRFWFDNLDFPLNVNV
jgi:uncharacterized lipoprotein YajG